MKNDEGNMIKCPLDCYNGGFYQQVCCGRGNGYECCGDPMIESQMCECCKGKGVMSKKEVIMLKIKGII